MEPITDSFHPFYLQAMQADIELLLRCEDKDVYFIEKMAADWFHSVEKRFSRLLEGSEINQLNTLAGENCLVSNTMLEVLFLAETYQAMTDGHYMPLMQNKPPGIPSPSNSSAAWKVNPQTKTLRLPDQTSIDLGGIEKSWSVKRLADYMQKTIELKQGLIVAGGDMAVWGRTAGQLDPWLIGIQNPWNANAKIGAVALPEGALSTYSVHEEKASHPGSDILQCTVAGQDVVECHVWARTLCSLGIEEGLGLLAERTISCEAVVLSTENKLHYFGSQESLGRRWIDLNIDHFHFQAKVS
ncbi:FAD:protein FMN transferase [Paenibacillus sp. GCM10027628]|uniref:FAD:protein FMN transferase n=1 Tax=Paenibacillus sp. GCM10027628 TaxID=3273413 RepID=UPI003630CFF1